MPINAFVGSQMRAPVMTPWRRCALTCHIGELCDFRREHGRARAPSRPKSTLRPSPPKAARSRVSQRAFQSGLGGTFEKDLAHGVSGQLGAFDHATTVDLPEQRANSDGSANMCNASSAGVPTGTTKIVAGRLALIAMTAFFGQMPMHRVAMMRTSRRWPASFSARRRAQRRVSPFFGPFPPSSLLAHLPQSRMMVFHGVGRVWISCLVFTAALAALDALPLICNQAASLISPYIWARNRVRAR